MRVVGIRNHLLLLALLPGTVIALALFGYFTRAQLALVNESQHERGVTIAQQLAPASEYGFIAGNTELLDQLATSLLVQADIKGVAITDTAQRLVFAAGDLGFHRQLPPVQESSARCADYGEQQLYCAPIVKTELPVSDFAAADVGKQRIIGAVYVEISTASLQQQRNAIVARAIVITGVLLLLTGYFAARVGNAISRPLVNITTAVGKVAAGNLELRTRSGAKGEVGRLESGIDAMIVSLRVARDEMQSNIDKATQQLRQALAELGEKNVDLNEQRLRAQAASEAKSRFLANMSHEIRTPLSGMVGLLFLLRHTKPSVEQQEYLENLEASAATLRTLIDDILDLSRIEAGRLVIHEQEFLLRNLASSVALILAPAAHQKDVELVVHITHDVPLWVIGDPLRLRQVLTNLLGNAVKFTEHGHVRLYVSLAPERHASGRRVRFAIEDSGIGIAEEKLDYIFESFAQADESTTRRFGGSGLGTTISRELVALMGGVLEVTSEQGTGTSFTFALPMVAGDGDVVSQPRLPGRRILLLEEHPLAGPAQKTCLESHGFHVTRVTTEEQLLAEMAPGAEGWHLILLAEDSRHCKWTGLARRLRDEPPAGTNVRLGALVFYDSVGDSTPFDLTLHKPLDGESLARRLDELDGAPASLMSAESRAVSGEHASLNVLLAEDDAINARVMTFFLRQKNHVVVVAGNGREALELLRSRRFDIGFLDMRMPEMDGLMVARQWRREEDAGGRLPLIAVTANVTREDRAACFDAGMDDFVSKPVDPERLAELLRRYAQRR